MSAGGRATAINIAVALQARAWRRLRRTSASSIVFTVRRYALHGLSYRNFVRLSVCLSVCHTRALCPHGSTYDLDFFTIW